MGYALATIWYERQRFLPAIFAVAFSAILIAVQGGLVIGLLSMMSVPIDKSTADVWIGYPGVRSVDLGQKIPERWVNRVANQPEVVRTEPYVINFVMWSRIDRDGPPATPVVVTNIGCRLDPDSLGAVQQLRDDPNLRAKLGEPFTVVVDESELGRLDIRGVGDTAEIMGRRVRVVGLVSGYKSLGGPYVFSSLETARAINRYTTNDCSYILARCKNPEDAEVVKQRLARYQQLSAFDADEFSTRSRMHWLTTTKAGIAVGFTALLGLLVGAVVTSQTLYAATAASQREFSTLRAMGIPGWRLRLTVVTQSLWVGLFGLIVALPLAWLIAQGANALGTQVRLHPIVVTVASCVTLLMAFGSGLAALRSFSGVDPAHNIR
jgi:putative ABC transport system permease protein